MGSNDWQRIGLVSMRDEPPKRTRERPKPCARRNAWGTIRGSHPATTSMIGNALKRNSTDRPLFRLTGPYLGHPKAMRLQVEVKSFGRQLSKVRCQTQTLKLALSVAFGIGHAHLLEEVSDRTPSLVLSVVHTTEQHPRVRDSWTRLS